MAAAISFDIHSSKTSRRSEFFKEHFAELPKPIDTSLSFAQIIEEIAQAKQTDVEINAELDHLLTTRGSLQKQMTGLESCTSKVISLDMSSNDLAENVKQTSITASVISKKIRELDTVESRLRQALERVETVLDLKNTIQTVELSIQSEDFETASSNTYRVLHQAQGEQMRKCDEVAYDILVDLEKDLQKRIVERCEAALKKENYQKAMRYSKLYGRLSMSQDGLAHYCTAVRQQVSNRMESEGRTLNTQPQGAVVPYLDIIPYIFDQLIECFNTHSRELRSSFGFESLQSFVVELRKEADVLIVPLLQRFIGDRSLNRTTRMIDTRSRAYQMSFHSDMLADNEKVPELDPRKLDELLEEVAFLCSESEHFSAEMERLSRATQEQGNVIPHSNTYTDSDSRRNSEVNELVQRLVNYYIEIEQYFMLENIFKAMKIDHYEEGTKTSSMVDDVFYIVKKCAERAFTTYTINAACAIVNHVNSVLVGHFKQKLEADLKEQLKLQEDSFANKLFQARNQPDHSKLFVVLNNMDTASVYMLTLKKQLQERFEDVFSNLDEKYLAMIRSCLDDLSDTSQLFSKSKEHGISKHVSVLAPLLQQSLDDFSQHSYKLTEENFSENEVNDPFTLQFIQEIQIKLSPLQDTLSRGNFDMLTHALIDFIIQQIETSIFEKKFTFWGGLQFDKDVRALIAFFSGLCDTSVREKFARLTQISSILQLENVKEIYDYWSDSESIWLVDASEVKRVLSLREEFTSRSINKIRL